jgi:hypothetical protein
LTGFCQVSQVTPKFFLSLFFLNPVWFQPRINPPNQAGFQNYKKKQASSLQPKPSWESPSLTLPLSAAKSKKTKGAIQTSSPSIFLRGWL